MSGRSRVGLMLLSAGLYGLSFPPYGSPLVAWFAITPFLLALPGLAVGPTLALSWISGLVMAYAITDFLPDAVANYYAQGPVFGMLLFIASVSVMCCLSHMAFAVWYRWPGRPRGALGPFLVGAAWVVAEFVRGDLEGNPWGTMGYTQARILPLVQIAEWTGVYGVSFLLLTSNATIADLIEARRAGRIAHPEIRRLAAVGLLVAIVFGLGSLRLTQIEDAADATVPIAVVQGNIDLGARWQRELYGRNLEEYLEQTQIAGEAAEPKVVFWPENAMTFFVEDEPLYRAAIGHTLEEHGMELVAGGPSRVPGGEFVRNSAFLLDPDGEIRARYDKRVLLPFAEYFPAWLAFFLRRDFDGVREFAAGEVTPPLPSAVGRATVVTCNEALFPRTVNQRVAEGSDYLVSLANDGWLGVHKYSERVVDMVAFRSVEQRKYTVRASSSGGSAVIAPSGRVMRHAAPFAAEVLHATIGPRSATTAYGRFGDLFVLLCAMAVVAMSLRSRFS